MLKAADLLDLKQFEHTSLFESAEFCWDALKNIPAFLKTLDPANHAKLVGAPYIEPNVRIGRGTVVEHGAVILGPSIIGENCQIRAGAYIRGNVVVGNDCVLGNSCEFKSCILFNGATVPHFNYVGDSILGHKAHLGAGVILSNVKLTKENIKVTYNGRAYDTGLRKFGAVIGDDVEIGCNAVLNPGSIVGRKAVIYAGTNWRGVCPHNTVVKLRQEQQLIERRF
jgi:NDP-sugar pyrophosphorylase family protein